MAETANQGQTVQGQGQEQNFSPSFIQSMQGARNALGFMDKGQGEAFDYSKIEQQQEATAEGEGSAAAEGKQQQQQAAAAEGATAERQQQQQQAAAAEGAAAVEGIEGQQQQQQAAAEGAEGTEGAEGVASVIKSEAFGEIKLSKEENKSQGTYQSFESVDDLNKYFEESGLGFTVDKLPEELPKLVEKSTQFDEVKGRVDQYNQIFEQMPEDIVNIIKTWGDAGDWRAEASKIGTSIDFSKKFDDQDPIEITQRYLPGKISQEDIEEYTLRDGSPEVKEKVNQLIEIAEEKYNLDQQKFATEKQRIIEQGNQYREKLQNSFNATRESALKTFQEAGMPLQDNYLNRVDKTFSDDAILSAFKNPDGTFKPEAYQMYVMAQDGFNIVKQFILAAQRQTASSVRTEVLEGTSATPATKKSGDASTDQNKTEQQKAEAYVSSVLGKKVAQQPTYQ